MKSIFCILLSSISFLIAKASDTLYFPLSPGFERATLAEAKYIRKVISVSEGELMALDYTLSNKLVAIRYFTDTNFSVYQHCTNFYDTTKQYRYGIACFKDGVKDGVTAGFDAHGDTLWVTKFSNGKVVSYKEFSGFKESEEFPHFPGGAKGWQKFLLKNLRYPQKAIDQNIQGTVIVSFMVSEEGKLSDFQIEKSVDESLDQETIRLLKSGPDWTPAIKDGRKIAMRQQQPMVFRLEVAR